MARLVRLIGGRHWWAEDASKNGVLVQSNDYEPIASLQHNIRRCVAYVPADTADDDRLFERVVRPNGVIEWYEVLP